MSKAPSENVKHVMNYEIQVQNEIVARRRAASSSWIIHSGFRMQWSSLRRLRFTPRLYVCLSVCLSVCQQLHIKTADRIFVEILLDMYLLTSNIAR